jgi:uncharacterized surface protein with fasciclin (FAS1) repeats
MNTQDKDVVANAANAGHFTTLSAALKATGLETTYKAAGPFTFFAPTDDAFRKLPPGTLDALLKDKARLTTVLNFHVTRGQVLLKDFRSHDLASVQGEALTMVSRDDGFTVNGAKGSKQEIRASNGVIHGIDSVMIPKG